eukprot:3904203-Prymnesium_polylepis.1
MSAQRSASRRVASPLAANAIACPHAMPAASIDAARCRAAADSEQHLLARMRRENIGFKNQREHLRHHCEWDAVGAAALELLTQPLRRRVELQLADADGRV